LVRNAPNSSFTTHQNDLGKEFFVHEGVFEDEHVQYPAGTFSGNPAGSSHTPLTKTGCTLLVKLRYQDPSGDEHLVINTQSAEWYQGKVPWLNLIPF
jgi:hypothetical protein